MEAPCLGMLWGTEAAHGETLLEQQQVKQASLQVPVCRPSQGTGLLRDLREISSIFLDSCYIHSDEFM